MLQDPLGTYEEARRRHAELHATADRHRHAASLESPSPWRLRSALLLRRLADRVEGACAECQRLAMPLDPQ